MTVVPTIEDIYFLYIRNRRSALSENNDHNRTIGKRKKADSDLGYNPEDYSDIDSTEERAL